MIRKAVLLDTSFFLRFLNDADPFFKNADNYYRHFLYEDVSMVISTISIAEYCVVGDVSDTESYKIYTLLKEHDNPAFQFINLNEIYHEASKVLTF